MKLVIDGNEYEAQVSGETVTLGSREFEVKVEGSGSGTTVSVNGRRYKVHRWGGDNEVAEINVDGKIYQVAISGLTRAAARPAPKKSGPKQSAEPGAVTALMPGRVVRVDVTEGQEVASGDVLLVLEAMKMENEIRAEVAGTIRNLQAKQGASVAAGDTLLVIE